jgi:gluconolactonase
MNTITRMAGLVGLTAGLAFSAVAIPQLRGSTCEPIVPEDSRLEHLFAGGEFTEGPAVAPDGSVFFSDLTFVDTTSHYEGHIWRFNPRTGSCTIYRSPSNLSNGIEFDAKGRMVVAEGGSAGGRRIVRTNLSTGKTEILAMSYQDAPFNAPNDLAIDAKGRIYFTDPCYDNTFTVRQPVMGVYRIEESGKITLLIEDVPMPNGIVLSPDQRTLYVGCFDEGEPQHQPMHPKRMAIYAYALSESGNVVSRKMLVDYGSHDGPDGMTVDARGNLFVAVRDEDRPGICVYDPAGTEIGFITVPEIPSNVAFDRPPNQYRLYITAGRGLYRVALKTRGCVRPHASPGKRK